MSNILNLSQYRYFHGNPEATALERFRGLHPAAEHLVVGLSDFDAKVKGILTHDWNNPLRRRPTEIDHEMFCHEFGHCMDLVARGQEEKLLLENFGWPRISNDKWSVNMAKNESRVFVYQWLLQEELGFSHKSGLLGPNMVSIFLKGMTRKEMDSGDFLMLFDALREDISPYWKDTLNKTVEYLAAAVDAERISS